MYVKGNNTTAWACVAHAVVKKMNEKKLQTGAVVFASFNRKAANTIAANQSLLAIATVVYGTIHAAHTRFLCHGFIVVFAFAVEVA